MNISYMAYNTQQSEFFGVAMAHTNHYLKLQPSEKSALEASLA
jgi:hypothetical protein